MYSTPFNIEIDLAPIPFDRSHCEMAAQLKKAGLTWRPHVGCFVWDCDEQIKVPSPFPERIYFILNLGRFLEIFESTDMIIEKMIWIPTWHQARLLCDKLGIDKNEIMETMLREKYKIPDDEVLLLYKILLEKLKKN